MNENLLSKIIKRFKIAEYSSIRTYFNVFKRSAQDGLFVLYCLTIFLSLMINSGKVYFVTPDSINLFGSEFKTFLFISIRTTFTWGIAGVFGRFIYDLGLREWAWRKIHFTFLLIVNIITIYYIGYIKSISQLVFNIIAFLFWYTIISIYYNNSLKKDIEDINKKLIVNK